MTSIIFYFTPAAFCLFVHLKFMVYFELWSMKEKATDIRKWNHQLGDLVLAKHGLILEAVDITTKNFV